METWVIFAIVSIFLAGFNNFIMKIAAERKYNISILNIVSFGTAAILVGGYLLIMKESASFDNIGIIALLAFGNSVFAMTMRYSKIFSLRNIDTVIFYPLYKTLSPCIVLAISIGFFQESLTIKEGLGILVGVTVPLLLISSGEKKRQKNLYRGLGLLAVAAICASVAVSFSNQISIHQYNIALFLLFFCIFSITLSGITYSLFPGVKQQKKTKISKEFVGLAVFSGFLIVSTKACLILALNGNLAVVYTINSFSILIPIILSIIFYKEHFNLKKALVMVLSIISIILFI